jgi:arginine exporter protein ArgO
MINYLLAGLLGLLFVTIAKASSMKKDFEVANERFVLKKFLENELYAISMSVVTILLMAITINEWVLISPKVSDYVTIIFALGGAIGSWAFLLFLGKSKKYIRKIVDEKTNIADGKN